MKEQLSVSISHPPNTTGRGSMNLVRSTTLSLGEKTFNLERVWVGAIELPLNYV